MVEVGSRLSRRAAIAATLAVPAALSPGTAVPVPHLSPAIASRLVEVRERRASMGPLIEAEDRAEALYFVARADLSDEQREALRHALGLNDAEDAVVAGWEHWRAALDELLDTPAASIADVEAKFRAVADCDAPQGVCMGDFAPPYLRAIWRDPIRLSGGTGATPEV